ncbi:DinB family protein [Lutibacter maritimus]|uniref:DinB family protein n=1 Tax=Lutibacter maritimus TaxID=593133 RepID=A0A1I6RYJ0_9FLAO|nr:DinB family protein [Lutibacter maritimus]SFS69558.1 DinB family protein [Lutibacter maritimus]
MKTYCKQNLEELKKLVIKLSDQEYTYGSKLLSNATIGQHVRHILEFYQSVLDGLDSKIINYDNRKRNLLIETNKDVVIEVIESICSKLTMEFSDALCYLEGNFSENEKNETLIKTTVFRELAYCLEHSIHHQALIKVGLLELNKASFIDENFGLAPATIRYKRKCVQ